THVLFSPNKVKFDGEKRGPADLDLYVRQKAEVLERKLERPAEEKPAPTQYAELFAAQLGSPLRDIDIEVPMNLPGRTRTGAEDIREFRIPKVAKIGDVAVEHIRAMAYVPTEEIGREVIYGKDNSEANDIDFVTVESRIDYSKLAESFHECFAGADVPEDWRDPCYASPVFAAVDLQRRQVLAGGTWSDWKRVPRSRIDPRKELFAIIEDAEKLPTGGIQVRMLNFDNKQAMIDVLQPEAYRIASAYEEWFPPLIHKDYAEYQKEIESEERREAREAEKKKREEEREKALMERRGIRGETTSWPSSTSGRREEAESGRYEGRGLRPRGTRGDLRRGPGGRRGGGWNDEDEYRAAGRRPPSSKKKSSSAKEKESKKLKDFYDDYEKLLIGRDTELSKLEEPLVFWAHDDTVEPGSKYQYRIRLGVFNPIAGTELVSKQDESQKNQVILWSDFSAETETVDIPARLYFFPQKIQRAAKTVTVKVCRFALGHWYSADFRVKHGEVIGKAEEVDPEIFETDEDSKTKTSKELTIPETIDYSTGALYVDAVFVNSWAGEGNIRAKSYFDMLYSYDGASIEHLPISKSYWPQEMQSKFSEIEELEERLKKPLRDWGAKPVEYKRRPTRDDEDDGWDDDEEYDREMRAAGLL
ncbi:MAG: hypothetical protein ACYSX1_00600, partial [Planctomycetota bacterium]